MKARTRLLVLNKFQKWFLFNFVFYTGLFLVVLGVGLFVWFKVIVSEVMQIAGLLSETFVSTIQKNILLGGYVLIILVSCLLALAAIQSLWFSRRIAGPIFALARHLENCEKSGRVEHLTLRKGDLFCDIAEKFNRLADKVNQSKGV
ncbi:MAG: hypothetical protein JWQ35_2414 [Bacteriovoracaceae bacterium]|nr:hypothetical protein [Bacteriovoracaceae bacterium]